MGEQITKPKTSGKLWSSSMENNTVVDIFDVFIKNNYLMDGNLFHLRRLSLNAVHMQVY